MCYKSKKLLRGVKNVSKWLATIFDDELFDAKYKTAKSIIEKENERIILRNINYPDKGYIEWIISKDAITINTSKRKGLITETINMSRISELNLKLSGHMGTLNTSGNIPKLWYKGIVFNLADVFVAHAAAAYIASLRQGDIQANIDPTIVEMRNQLDAGELDEKTMTTLRDSGVLDAIGFVAPTTPVTTPQVPMEVSASQSTSSVADELLKLKSLVDTGVLAQEEFDHKKKSLLGM